MRTKIRRVSICTEFTEEVEALLADTQGPVAALFEEFLTQVEKNQYIMRDAVTGLPLLKEEQVSRLVPFLVQDVAAIIFHRMEKAGLSGALPHIDVTSYLVDGVLTVLFFRKAIPNEPSTSNLFFERLH